MRLTLDALHVIDTIERRGSFAAAAEELHRVPSAVTYTVQKLEQDLGVKLFDRSGHRAVLTEAGRELLREGRHMLRAADVLEARVKRVATGWEAELRIAYDDVIPVAALMPLVGEFYKEHSGTRVRVHAEIFGGCWDALMSGRADLVIGAPGEGPPGGGYTTRLLGNVDWVFVVAPHHPLAEMPEPLSNETLLMHRVVAAADSSRNLPARTAGILTGQDVLTVHNLEAKIAAQRAGIGVGRLPRHLVEEDLAAGRLVIKETEEAKPSPELFLAWHTAESGRALSWFIKRLEDGKRVRAALGIAR
ncbi:MAG: LysR family transcriptional regulator [Betaproteobacteria bacterium]|nr:LysR family transcriptional regulator [Betaproteobacteria bacterium]